MVVLRVHDTVDPTFPRNIRNYGFWRMKNVLINILIGIAFVVAVLVYWSNGSILNFLAFL
jgi:hypothetical protein